jgi:hypothetical protein
MDTNNKKNNKFPPPSTLNKLINNITIKKLILITILLVLLIVGSYLLIKWYMTNKTEYVGYSYYPEDLDNYVSRSNLFTLNTTSLNDCKQHCIRTPKCKGITLKPSDEKCYGFAEGSILRREIGSDLEITSWIKPEDSIFHSHSELLLTMTELPFIIDKNALMQPFMPGRYNYNFYIFIENFKSDNWKHVFHKGNEIQSLFNNDWDNIITNVPEQFIGVWIAPYNTYMRIAVTTKEGIIEYVDIPNIPINKLTFVSVSLLDNIIEVYINAKLVKTYILSNIGIFNNGNLYVKYDNSFNGEIYYITYTPEYLDYNEILKLYETSINEVTNETIKKYGQR